MVLPEEIEDAAFDGDVDAVRAFLAQHPERVDDVGDDGMRAAQSTSTSTRLTPWQKYCLVPPKELLRLRSQIARGKAVATRSTPPHLARLFARSLPNEIAWRVLAFWNPRH